MRELPLELDDETLEALETERRLIGFESRAAYVRWLVDHRGSISEAPGEGERALEAARERIATLEAQLEAARQGDDPDRTADDPAPAATDSTDDGWRRSRSDPTIEVRGSPRTTVSRDADDQPTRAGATDRPATERDDPDVDAADRVEADAGDLTPERVVRIPGDPVSADADVLESVELDRLDELSRRAVAKTRRRLNRDVETGLEYRSSTGLAGGDVRPGEDVVDLESLSIPGRSPDRVERRRAVAGRALAFLRDEKRARKSDFVDALYAEYPAGYETPEGWWSFVKTALKQVDAIEGGGSARVWRYTG